MPAVMDNCCSCGEAGECRGRAKGGEHEFSGFVPYSPIQIAGSPYSGSGTKVSPPSSAEFRATYDFGQNYAYSGMAVFLDGPIEAYRQPPVQFGDTPRVRKRFLRVVVSGTGYRLAGPPDPGYDSNAPNAPIPFTFRHEFWVERHTNSMRKAVYTFDGAETFREEVTDAGIYSTSGERWRVWTDQDPLNPSVGPYVNLEPPSYDWKSSSAIVTETTAAYSGNFDYTYTADESVGFPSLTTVELQETSLIELFDEYSEEDCLADATEIYDTIAYGGTYPRYIPEGTVTLDWGTRVHGVWIRDYGAYLPGNPPNTPPTAPLVIGYALNGSGPSFRGALCDVGTVYRVGLTEGYVWGSQAEMSTLAGTHSCFITREWAKPVPDTDPDPDTDTGHDGQLVNYDCVLDLGIGAGVFALEPQDPIFQQSVGCFQWQCAPSEIELSPCFPYQVECAGPPP